MKFAEEDQNIVAIPKPATVVLAVRLLYLCLLLSVLTVVWWAVTASRQGGDVTTWLLSLVGICAFFLLLVVQVNAGKNWARIVLLVLTVIGALKGVPDIQSYWATNPSYSILSAAQDVLGLAAVFLLFTGKSPLWFRPASESS